MASSPKAGSFVGSPLSSPVAIPLSMARNLSGTMKPSPIGIPFKRI